jgi:hypothetical protein
MKKLLATTFLAVLCTGPLQGCASDPLGLQSANSMGRHPELDSQVKDANDDLKTRKITGDTK